MGLFRLIFYIVIIWLIARLIRTFFPVDNRNAQVQGHQKSAEPLDLKDADIEDADFEEIEG
jgi:Na+-transporting methylmalonyl-CoA/oxaloacetate decarboxylase gamma subunit